MLNSIDMNDLTYKRKVSLCVYDSNKNTAYRNNFDCQDYTVIYFESNLVYVIYKKHDCIKVFTDDCKKVFSSLFNAPLAVFCIRDSRILLHSSSVENNNFVYGFIGEKGKGKSTAVAILSQRMNFFSDDTLVIEKKGEGIIAYKSAAFLRLNQDSYESITGQSDYSILYHNSAGKACVYPQDISIKYSHRDNSILKKVFILERKNDKDFSFMEIENATIKKLMISKHIIGINHLNSAILLSRQIQSILHVFVSSVSLCRMYIPDDIYFNQQKLVQAVDLNLGLGESRGTF